MPPGCVWMRNAGLSWMGPPGWNVPTALTALIPGMPTATRRAATSATGSAARPAAAIDIASVTMMDTTTLRVLGFIRSALHERRCAYGADHDRHA